MTKKLLIETILSILTFSSTSYGQLGTASTFALFTANGALTNVGSSTVVGDIGTNVGAISGFNTAMVTGNTRAAGSPESMQAATDVMATYNTLAAATCGTTIQPELGGQTLTPGIYCQSTASPTTLNGTLTLSGAGTFIIKLSSALTTATNSNIVLTNGASANNVFFQIVGAATLGTGSTFRGSIVALGAIVLNTTTLEGRALSTTGAITLNESRVTTVAAPLPVTLVSFEAKASTMHTVDLYWTTSLETNNKIFVIERSKDLKQFEKVGEVSDVAANSKALKNYHLTDEIPYAGTSYYRLTQIDLSGKATVYPSVSLVLRDEAYGVFPNPVANEGRFTLRLDEPETALVSLYSIDGRLLPIQKKGIQSGNLLLTTSATVSVGIYILKVEERGQTRYHRLVIK